MLTKYSVSCGLWVNYSVDDMDMVMVMVSGNYPGAVTFKAGNDCEFE